MGGPNLSSSIAPVAPVNDETRQLAVAGVHRRVPAEDVDEILAILGLAAPPVVVEGRQRCEDCGGPLPDPIVNGGHKPCRRKACAEKRTQGATGGDS
jgi:hypothetical protein